MATTPSVSSASPESSGGIDNQGTSLATLLREAWHHKWIVIACAIIGCLLAAAFLLAAPRAYQTETRMRPVSLESFQRIPLPPVKFQVTPDIALALVKSELASPATFTSFVKANPVLFQPVTGDAKDAQAPLQGFGQENITVGETRALGESVNSVYLRVTYPPQLDGAAIANELLHFAIAQAKAKGIKAFDDAVAVELLQLRQKIDTKRLRHIDQLKYESMFLDQQLQIAQSLDFQQPKLPSNFSNVIFGEKGLRRLDEMYPVYYRGAIALRAQLAAIHAELASSKDWLAAHEEDPMNERPIEILPMDYNVSGLPEQVQEARQLSRFRLNLDHIKVVDITQEATAASRPARPRTALIIGLGGALGLLAGLYWVLFRAIARSRRKE